MIKWPLKTRISVALRRFLRRMQISIPFLYATKKSDKLPIKLKSHKSLLLRQLEGVDMTLQHNKVVNLTLAGKQIDNIIIKPGQIFSLWKLVGNPTERRGFKLGLIIAGAGIDSDFGGGLCQLANMLYWLGLHSPLTEIERHHHSLDLFPDNNRQVPFGTGCSIFFNYADLRFKNNSKFTVQFRIWLDHEYLNGEVRVNKDPGVRYHIKEEDHRFTRDDKGDVYRENILFRDVVDVNTGNLISHEKLYKNHAKVMYTVEGIDNRGDR